MGLGLLFPGQGAQLVGMGADLYRSHPPSKAIFDRAAGQVDFDLISVCFEGPEEALAQTSICQVAIYVTSLAVWGFWKEVSNRPKPRISAGLSLGEYTALTVSGALSAEEGLDLVALRGALMQEACDASPGTMASVIGLSGKQVEEALDGADGIVQVGNYNSPTQVVITGEAVAVRQAMEICREKGAKRVLELKVAGAYHSPLMRQAEEALRPRLGDASIREPSNPVILNVTGRESRDPEEIREGLIRQVTSPVRWSESMGRLRGLGVERVCELGPGRVLKGLLRQIDRDLPVTSLCSAESIQADGEKDDG